MGLAEQYEKVRTVRKRSALARLAERKIRKGYAVIDVGCGTGSEFPLLRRLVGKSGEVWAVEPNPEMLVAAKKKAKRFGVKLFRKKAEEVSSLGKKFDVIFASLSLQFADVGRSLEAFRRSLKPEGQLLFLIPSKRPGISNAEDAESRRFKRVFDAGVRGRLKRNGLPAEFDFSYVYGRGRAFRKALSFHGFKVAYWKEGIRRKSGLKGMLDYYTIPWRSERAMPKVRFEERFEVITESLKDAFARFPGFKVKRYYIVCAARKA